MVIYIEYVLIDNFVMTYIIGYLTYAFLRVRADKKRLAAASLLGSAVALVYPLVEGIAWLLLIKAALALCLTLILFLKKSRLILSGGIFLLVTAAMGGALLLLGYCVTGDVKAAMLSPLSDLPVTVIVLPPFILCLLIKKISLRLNRRRDIAQFIYGVQITYNGKIIKLKGFLDSGNQLYDERTGLPVVLIGLKFMAAALSDDELGAVMGNKGERLKGGAHYIGYGTVTAKSRLLVLKPQKFQLYYAKDKNIFIDVMLGLVTYKFKGGYQAILSPACIENKGV